MERECTAVVWTHQLNVLGDYETIHVGKASKDKPVFLLVNQLECVPTLDEIPLLKSEILRLDVHTAYVDQPIMDKLHTAMYRPDAGQDRDVAVHASHVAVMAERLGYPRSLVHEYESLVHAEAPPTTRTFNASEDRGDAFPYQDIVFPTILPHCTLSASRDHAYGISKADLPGPLKADMKAFEQWATRDVDTDRIGYVAVQSTTIEKQMETIRSFLGFSKKMVKFLKARGMDDQACIKHCDELESWLGRMETQVRYSRLRNPTNPASDGPSMGQLRSWTDSLKERALSRISLLAEHDAGMDLTTAVS
eukprot:gene21718-28738_t